MPETNITPSPIWKYTSRVSETKYAEASAALDKALLDTIGLPESIDIRDIENGLYSISEKVKYTLQNFSLSKLIGELPSIISDALVLWEKIEPKVKDSISRKDFAVKVIRYGYRRNDPDIPVIPEPFETIIEDLILNAVPILIDKLDTLGNNILNKVKEIFS